MTRVFRTSAVLLGAVLAAGPVALAQGSTASTTTQAAASLMLFNPPGSSFYARLDTIGHAVTVAGKRADVFHALRSVYADLQIPLTLVDSANGWLGTLRLVRTYTLGPMRLSRALDCGSEMTGPVADDSRVELAVVTFTLPEGANATSVRTAVVASSQSIGGEQRDRVQCSTTGYLEEWIRGRLLERRVRS